MRFRLMALIFLISSATLVSANLFEKKASINKFSQTFPAAVCPPTGAGLNGQVSTGSRNTLSRKVIRNSSVLVPVKSSRFPVGADPVLLEGSSMTSLTWQSLASKWAGATLCKSPENKEWFVGGTGDVTSKGRLLLVNSGLSKAIVDVALWSENGPLAAKVFTVEPNSFSQVRLDALAVAQNQLVVRVTPRSGRVSTFMIDERSKGLSSLGGDFVNSVATPRTDFMIAGIPNQIAKSRSTGHILRILSPGNAKATVSVELISSDGTFNPIGLDSFDVARGLVTEVTFSPNIQSNVFSLHVKSDQPILASVYSQIVVSGHKDFLWNIASTQIAPMSVGVSGLEPTLTFTGNQIRVTVESHLDNGRVSVQTIKGTDIVSWKVKSGTRSIKIISSSPGVYGSGLVTSANGIGTFPLTPGSLLSRVAIPSSNISVINR